MPAPGLKCMGCSDCWSLGRVTGAEVVDSCFSATCQWESGGLSLNSALLGKIKYVPPPRPLTRTELEALRLSFQNFCSLWVHQEESSRRTGKI